MANKMLVDAAHPEETRVVVLRGNRVEEFDFESASRKQLRGNIYLAKVTRVEPSLQAAFVDYGGNRHGFLAFSEIHPDYYQIPVADRQALIAAEEAEMAEAEARHSERDRSRGRRAAAADAEQPSISEPSAEDEASPEEAGAPEASEIEAPEAVHEDAVATEASETEAGTDASEGEVEPTAEAGDDVDSVADAAADSSAPSEPDAGDGHVVSDDVVVGRRRDAMEEVPERRTRTRVRQYKIQEVIKRRQVLLVQVVKEERGNKGAALTTYLSSPVAIRC